MRISYWSSDVCSSDLFSPVLQLFSSVPTVAPSHQVKILPKMLMAAPFTGKRARSASVKRRQTPESAPFFRSPGDCRRAVIFRELGGGKYGPSTSRSEEGRVGKEWVRTGRTGGG